MLTYLNKNVPDIAQQNLTPTFITCFIIILPFSTKPNLTLINLQLQVLRIKSSLLEKKRFNEVYEI